MVRHSLQAHTRAYFTSGERARTAQEYGTVSQRLGADSQKRFDQCQLCAAPLRDPVATPYGSLYCRECILTNLLSQRQALDEQQRAYDDAAAGRSAATAAAAAAEVSASATAFAQQEGGSLATAASRSSSGGGGGIGRGALAVASTLSASRSVAAPPPGASALGAATAAAAAAAARLRIDPRDRESKVADAKLSSPWTSQSAGGTAAKAGAAAVAPPEPAPRDPSTGGFLRAKQLITVRLARDGRAANSAGSSSSSSSSGGGGGGDVDDADTGVGVAGAARFQCPGCSKPIVFQATYLLKACGHVVCGACLSSLVAPSKACLECSAPAATKGDVIKLQQGGSSYAGGSGTQTEASKYTPNVF